MTKIYKDKKLHKWLHFIRLEEINSIIRFLPQKENLELLEIGGGDGYLASIFDKKGYLVTSIDLEPRFPQSFPVQKVSNSKLPFEDNQFDIIFSSHVLEHVTDLKLVISELNRVSKLGATIIHIMPTPAWRVITSFWVLLFLPLRGLKFLGNRRKEESNSVNSASESQSTEHQENVEEESAIQKLKRMVFHPHGEYPSWMHEIYYFSAFRWEKVLQANNQKCYKIIVGPMLYSGKSVFSFSFVRLRKLVSKLLFSSSNAYIIEK